MCGVAGFLVGSRFARRDPVLTRFYEQVYYPAQLAAVVARHPRAGHTTLKLAPCEARTVIPKLATISDEPFVYSSHVPTVLMVELTPGHATVALSGGGDKLFGGDGSHRCGLALCQRTSRLLLGLRCTPARLVKAVPPGALSAGTKPMLDLMTCHYAEGGAVDKLYCLTDAATHRGPDAVYRNLISHRRKDLSDDLRCRSSWMRCGTC